MSRTLGLWLLCLVLVGVLTASVDYGFTKAVLYWLLFLGAFGASCAALWRSMRRLAWVLLGLGLVVCLVVGFVALLTLPSLTRHSLGRSQVIRYEVQITPAGTDHAQFETHERLWPVPPPPAVTDPTHPPLINSDRSGGEEHSKQRILSSASVGVFIRELRVPVWGTDDGWPARVIVPGRPPLVIPGSQFRPHAIQVVVRRLRSGAFLAAEDARALSRSDFDGTETISWEPAGFPPSIRFRFIDPRYVRWRSVLAPVLAAKNWPALPPLIAGALVAWLLQHVLAPELYGRVKANVQGRLARLWRRKPRQAGFRI